MKNGKSIWFTGLLACLLVLTAFTVVPALFLSPVQAVRVEAPAAGAWESTAEGPVVSPQATLPSQQGYEDASWELKVDRGLLETALKGSKDLQDVVIYTRDMGELAPLIEKYGILSFPEEFRGMNSREATRMTPNAEGIVSTRVMIPSYAIPDIAGLPGVLGVETRNMPEILVYTGLAQIEAQDQVNALRSGIAPTDYGSIIAHNAMGAWTAGGSGQGVYVAVQDWGLDFAQPNLMGQWATVTDTASPFFGYPIMHSQHSQWNNLELFTTSSDFDRYPYPHFATYGTATWYSDTSYRATANATGHLNYTYGNEEYGLWQFTKRVNPSIEASPGVIGRSYFVGAPGDPWEITSASGWFHLGVSKDKLGEVAWWGERVGILVVDSTTPFEYDTVYVDLDFDLNFTNDKPLTVTGDPVAGLDLDADGNYDISGGLLYFISNQMGSVTDEPVIAAATGSETGASLASGWIETNVEGVDLFMATMALDGMYWPSSGEDIEEVVIADTTGLGDETGTTSTLTAGNNIMTGAAVDTAALLADYDLSLIYDISNSSGALEEGVDFDIDMSTGEITWLTDFPDGDFVEIIYEFQTWTLNFDTGEITFEAPPIAGSAVTATYNTGLPVPYSNITAQRQGWDLFVPGPGDLIAMHGAFELNNDHGTAVASLVAGNPIDTTLGEPAVWGTAPESKLIGVDVPTSIDTAELFEFSAFGYDGIPNSGDEADIATNSWGWTESIESGFGLLERYLYDLTTSRVSDFTVLFAAGNNGPGYGTIGPPGSSPGVISVGAGTMMNYRVPYNSDGGIAYYDWPNLGTGVFGVGPFGDIADFSSKGPSLMGTPEPDVFAAGAFTFVAVPLNWYASGGDDAWDLYSGTSFSTPLTAGVVALIYEGYKGATGSEPDSWVAREILMSSADDHGFDVLQQGAGWVNASAAFELASSVGGIRVSPASLTPGTFDGVHRPAFVNMIDPGDSYMETLTVYNEGSAPAVLTIGDALYTKIAPDYEFVWDFSTPWSAREWLILKPSGLYEANGTTVIEAIDLSSGWNSADFIRITFERDPEVVGPTYTYIELFDWYDWTGGPEFDDFDERNRMTWAGLNPGTSSVTAQLFDPASRVHDGLAISFRDVANAFGLTPVTVEFYGKADWAWADAEAADGTTVDPGASVSFDVTFSVPADAQAGMYQGAILVDDVVVPVVITVPHASGNSLSLGGGTPVTTLYDNNGVSQGTPIDSTWRQTGDSRWFWADFTETPADNLRMIQSLLFEDAASEGEIILYELQSDPAWTDDAIYGPGTMVEIAANTEVFGETDANGDLVLNKELLATDVVSGMIAIQMRSRMALKGDEPFSLDVGTMSTSPIEARISSNQLSGSVPVSVTSNVPLVDGLFVLSFEQLPGDGVLTSEDPTIASSTTPTSVESVSLTDLDDNVYFIAVHGWDVPASPSTFDMTIATTISDGTTTTEVFTDLPILQDDPNDPYTASYVDTRNLVDVIHLDVDVVGQGSDDIDLFVMSDRPQFVIGAGAWSGQNVPDVTVSPDTATGFDLSWEYPVTRGPGILQDIVYLSPGFAPLAQAQSIDIVFSYDLTPPSFSTHLPAPGSTVSDSTPGIFVQIDDPSAGSISESGEIDEATIRIWLDGEDITSLASISVPHETNQGYNTGTILFTPQQPLSDGPHTLLAQAGDFAGNMATTTWTFTVDTTAPALAISSPTPGLVTSASSIAVSGVTEPGASVTVAGQSVFVDGAGNFNTIVSLTEGENVIEVSAADSIGNTASATRIVIQDLTAPAISQLRSSAGLLTNADLAVISGVVDEPVSMTVAGIPATVHTDGSFEVTVSLVEGSNTIGILATDTAGNQGSSSLTIVRDSVAPALAMDALPAETSDATLTVSGTVESGITFVTVNGQPVSVSGGQYSTDVALSNGPNEIFVGATDAAGNTATVFASISFVPTGVTVASVGLILLPVLTVVALLAGLILARRGPAQPPKEEMIPPPKMVEEPKEAPPKMVEEPKEGEE